MRRAILTVCFFALSSGFAQAQYGAEQVAARWNRSGAAVCPRDYDYVAQVGSCVARWSDGGGYRRGYGGSRGGYGGGVPARWNRAGSAVCPPGYDYVAHRNACFPQ